MLRRANQAAAFVDIMGCPMQTAGASSSIRGALWAADALRPFQYLTIGEMLQEVALVALDASQGRRALEPSDRRSFAGDVTNSLARTGRELRAELGQDLADVKSAVTHAKQVLTDVAMSERLYDLATKLERRLADPRVARAALLDLLEAVDNGATTSAVCIHRAYQLKQTYERQGGDWDAVRRSLVDALKDSRELALERAMRSPIDDTAVVWLILGNAVLDQPCRLGPIQFFSGDTARSELLSGSSSMAFDGFEAAWELTSETLSLLEPVRVKEHVLARVELRGPRALTPAVGARGGSVLDWARRFVSDVIAAATFRFGGSGWRMLDGAIGFTATGAWYGSGFHDPRERLQVQEWSQQRTDPTPEALHSIDVPLLRDLAAHKPPTYHAVEAALWHHGASATADPVQRIALRIRGFERLPPARPNQGWQQTLYAYLSGEWALDCVGRELVSAGFVLHNDVEMAQLRGMASQVLIGADRAIYSSSGGHYVVNTQAVIQNAVTVAAEFGPGSWGRRIFREVVRGTRDGDAMRQWLIKLQETSRTLIQRGARQRNSIVHGRLVSLAVASTVDAFLERMSGILVATEVDVLAGDVHERLVQSADRYAKRLDLLAGATSSDPFFATVA